MIDIYSMIPDEYENKSMLKTVCDDIYFTGEKIEEIKKLPFLKVHPKDPTKQKKTDAYLVYKNLVEIKLFQIKSIIKILENAGIGNEEISPLRQWFEAQNERLQQ